jgi:hypothetical protein
VAVRRRHHGAGRPFTTAATLLKAILEFHRECPVECWTDLATDLGPSEQGVLKQILDFAIGAEGEPT